MEGEFHPDKVPNGRFHIRDFIREGMHGFKSREKKIALGGECRVLF